jgi:hypothetical protein
MPKLSELNGTYEVVSVPEAAKNSQPEGSLKLSQMAPDSFEVVKLPEAKKELGAIDKGFKVVEDELSDAGKRFMNYPLGKALAWGAEKVEKYVDAPVRAQIGALQKDASFLDSIKAGGRQFGRETLPTTPSGKEIMSKVLPTTGLSDKFPGAFSETGEGAKLKKGGFLDISPAGVAGTLTQPSVIALPADALISGSKGVVSTGGRILESATTPIARAMGKAAEKGTSLVAKTGQFMTGGAVKAADIIDTASKLKGTELILPEAYVRKAGAKVGAARDVIESAGKELVAPGASKALEEVKQIILAGEEKAMKTPGSKQLLDRIDTALAHPKGVSVENIDDMIRDLNNVEYTPMGNGRSIEPRWAKPLAQARGKLEPLLKSTTEGAALSEAKEPFAALQTARGQQRSKLTNTISTIGGIGGATVAAVTSHPVIGAATYVASRSIAPRTYFQIIGAAKLPKQAANAMLDVLSKGEKSEFLETANALAARYPEEMGRFVTALARETDDSFVKEPISGGKGAIERRVNSK